MSILVCVLAFANGLYASDLAQSVAVRTLQLQLKEASLDVEKSLNALKKAKENLAQAKDLRKQGLYNIQELNRSEDACRAAELAYEQAAIGSEKVQLVFLKSAAEVTLERLDVNFSLSLIPG